MTHLVVWQFWFGICCCLPIPKCKCKGKIWSSLKVWHFWLDKYLKWTRSNPFVLLSVARASWFTASRVFFFAPPPLAGASNDLLCNSSIYSPVIEVQECRIRWLPDHHLTQNLLCHIITIEVQYGKPATEYCLRRCRGRDVPAVDRWRSHSSGDAPWARVSSSVAIWWRRRNYLVRWWLPGTKETAPKRPARARLEHRNTGRTRLPSHNPTRKFAKGSLSNAKFTKMLNPYAKPLEKWFLTF
jgi:hypothetical protein